jgi:membrane protein implicated in regulation of membrane protease activity
VLFVRPIALRYLHKNDPDRKSNADALLGRTGRVTEKIPAEGTGYVQIDGDLWRAVSSTRVPIEEGASVRVVNRESTIITVETL